VPVLSLKDRKLTPFILSVVLHLSGKSYMMKNRKTFFNQKKSLTVADPPGPGAPQPPS